jgi:DNA-binding SARP family transcriptional activator
MWLWNIGVLLGIAFGAWWLTGLDKTPAGESKRGHYFTRALRCLLIVVLVAVFLWFIQGGGAGMGGVVLLLIIPISIALVLRSSLAEIGSQGFLRMVDPTLHDDRELDSKRDGRYLDTIAHLIRNGRKDEAIRLCQEMKQTGELDPATLDMTLEFLGVKPGQTNVQSPANRAAQLRAQGDFSGAESLLKPLLVKNPADVQAALMLMRIYAQDLRQPDRAWAVLRNLEKQPHLAPAHLDFARRSIDEWRLSAPAKPVTIEPKSLEELLADKSYGSAVEMLEQRIQEQPDDLDMRLKLAEVYGRFCHNFPRAEKIVRQMCADHHFSAEQISLAEAKLKEWREAASQRK